MNLHSLFSTWIRGKSATQVASSAFFEFVFRNQASEADLKTALLLLSKKGETVEEISGCLEALRLFEKQADSQLPAVMDNCGTGGDGSKSFNISTVSAFVLAGAGIYVSKHGNRSVSSRCGSSDLMEALGVNLNASMPLQLRALREARIAYFHAPYFHPTFSKVQSIRRKLGTRTIFNFLGPLANPLKLSYQMMGVAQKEVLLHFAGVLKNLSLKRALVCHSNDGLDELSTQAKSDCILVESGKLQRFQIDPKRLGFKSAKRSELKGGDPSRNRDLALQILKDGHEGLLRDTILLNSGAAIWVAQKAATLEEGIEKATESLDSGRAYQSLLDLIRITQNKKMEI